MKKLIITADHPLTGAASTFATLEVKTHLIRSLTVLGSSLVLTLSVAQVTAVQAASLVYTDDPSKVALFEFSFGSNGRGSLSLQGVLTEPGLVTVPYSEIQSAALTSSLSFSYTAGLPAAFPNPRQLIFSFDPARDATLTFENGNLMALFYTSESQRFTFADGRYCNFDGGCIFGEGLSTLFLEGAGFRQFVSFELTEFNLYGQVVSKFQTSGNPVSGSITFSNLRSIEAVPEPTTILGTGISVVLAAACKRYHDRRVLNKFNATDKIASAQESLR